MGDLSFPASAISSACAPATACATQDRHRLAAIEHGGQLLELFRRRTNHGIGLLHDCTGLAIEGLTQSDVAGNRHHCDAPFGQGGLDGDFEHSRKLRRLRDEFAILAAAAEELIRMCSWK